MGILRKPDGEQIVEEVCREHNSNEQIFSRWRRKYGRMETADAKRLKGLCNENSDLKKMLADALLKNRVLEETRSEKGWPFVKEAGGEERCPARAVFNAKGMQPFEVKPIIQPISAKGGPGTSVAYCVAESRVSPIWLSTNSGVARSGRLESQPEVRSAHSQARKAGRQGQASQATPSGSFHSRPNTGKAAQRNLELGLRS